MGLDRFRAAMAALEAGRFQEAVEGFESWTKRRDDAKALLWLGMAYAEVGRLEDALACLRRARERCRPEVVDALESLVLLDAQRLDEAQELGARGARRKNRMAEAVHLLAKASKGEGFSPRMVALIRATNAHVAGRALYVAELNLEGLPDHVLRDFMDEAGIGWPHHRGFPLWLFQDPRHWRVWHLLASRRYAEAFALVSGWEAEAQGPGGAATMVAAALMAGEWEKALRWFNFTREARREAAGKALGRLDRFRVALVRGFLLAMVGDEQAPVWLEEAARCDSTSYLPHYLLGRVSLPHPRARRHFVAACARLNPGLATSRWSALCRTAG